VTRKSIVERSLALAIGLVVLLVLLELTLRLAGSFFDDPAQRLPTEFQPKPGDLVVLSMGDSMTWGIGASEGMTYPDQLQPLLEQALSDRGIAVFNGSMAGANSTIILALLEDYLRVLEPDVVTILTGGINKTNYYGFNAWKKRSTTPSRADDALHQVRVYRLWRYFSRHMGTHSAQQALVFDGVGAGVTACQKWHSAQGSPPTRSFEQGGSLLRVGRFHQARQVFEQGLAEDPGDSALLWGLATAHKGARNNAAAEVTFERCLQANPADPNCHYGLGELSLEGAPRGPGSSPELDAAETWFESGLKADPAFSANHWGMGMVHMKTNRSSDAVDAFLQCARADPDDTRCYPNLVTQAGRSKRSAEVERILETMAAEHQVADDYLPALRARLDTDSIDAWIRADLERMVELSQASGAKVIMQTYPYQEPTNELLGAIAREQGLPFADHRARFLQEMEAGVAYDDLFSADQLHCNDRGYGIMAATLRDAILGTLQAKPGAGGGQGPVRSRY